MKRYFPILLSKPGELIALANLSELVKNEVAPVIEVLNESIHDKSGVYSSKLHEMLIESWAFEENQIFLDFTFFENVDGNIPTIRKLFRSLFAAGINAVPVVKFNNTHRYLALAQTLISTYNCGVCIRTNNNSGGFLNFNTNVSALIARLSTNEKNTSLILDLGFAHTDNYNLLTTVAYQTIISLYNPHSWSNVIVASGSFLPDLGSLTPPSTNRSPARLYRLQRYEWDIWTTLNAMQLPRRIEYSDYGTKHPYYIPAGFEGSCSIKYTTTNHYVIFRGRKASEHAKAGGQYNDSAATLIASADYLGEHYSWGDSEIHAVGTRSTSPGNAGQWVQRSQNHHITHLHQLL